MESLEEKKDSDQSEYEVDKIYTPSYSNGKCIVIQSNGIIREYQTTPTYNSDITYKDYYTSMNYNYNEGIQHFSNYSTLPECRTGTNNIMYRTDINNTVGLVIIAIILLVDIVIKYLKESYK